MAEGRKLLIYTHAMAGGGAERVCAALASGFARLGDHVTLALDFESSANSEYVDNAVHQVQLGSGHVQNVLSLARVLRNNKPDVAMSALGISNLKLVIAAFLAGRLSRTILSYHGFSDNEPQFLSQLSYFLTPLFTRITAATVAVSDSLRRYLVEKWWAARSRTVRIYNPVLIKTVERRPDPAAPMILAVGRLNRQKNFCGLIRAFALVKTANARLVILGEGDERELITAEINRLNVGDRVSLPGYVNEPWRFYALASCLAISSETETFSLVIVEALANGLPVVTTQCRGPEEILDYGRFGRIVPYGNDQALAQAIDLTLASPGNAAPRILRAKDFSLEVGLAEYSRLFDEVIARHQNVSHASDASPALPHKSRAI